jgi:hypothetical protein
MEHEGEVDREGAEKSPGRNPGLKTSVYERFIQQI